MAAIGPRFISNGNIRVSRFVMLDSASPTSKELYVTEADGATQTKAIIGIASEATSTVPGVDTTPYAAVAGQELKVYSVGEECLLVAGTGGWGRGDILVSDTDGTGIDVDLTANAISRYGAIALTGASAGDLGRVMVILGAYFHS